MKKHGSLGHNRDRVTDTLTRVSDDRWLRGATVESSRVLRRRVAVRRGDRSLRDVEDVGPLLDSLIEVLVVKSVVGSAKFS